MVQGSDDDDLEPTDMELPKPRSDVLQELQELQVRFAFVVTVVVVGSAVDAFKGRPTAFPLFPVRHTAHVEGSGPRVTVT